MSASCVCNSDCYFHVQAFKTFGIEKYDPTNEPFDPHRHNAVFQMPDSSKPPGTVAAVLKVQLLIISRFLMSFFEHVFLSSADSESGCFDLLWLQAGYVLHERVIRPAEVGVTQAVENDFTMECSAAEAGSEA